jgi:hypothetical protein
MMQRFYGKEPFRFKNGAIGYAPGGPLDTLGPYAKVSNCPIEGTELRRTAYATGYAETHFAVPACTRVKGNYIGGFFTVEEGSIKFVPYDRYKDRLIDAIRKDGDRQ